MNSIVRNSMKLGLVAGVLTLTACTSIGYRCPLEPGKSPDHPTACAGMKDAMRGAKEGTGGRTSVLLDQKGRIVPAESAGKPINLTAMQVPEPIKGSNGSPVFHNPEVFKVWSRAYVDPQGNLHGDHNAWFTTPGRWAYGSLTANGEASEVAESLMEPAGPSKAPGRVVEKNQRSAPESRMAEGPPPALTEKERNDMALKGLASAANSVSSVNKTQNIISGGSGGGSINLLD